MIEMPTSPSTHQKREDGKRVLAFAFALCFMLNFIATLIQFWNIKRPLNVVGIKKSISRWKVDLELARADLLEANTLNPLEKKEQHVVRQQVFATTVSQAVKAEEAKKLKFALTDREIDLIQASKLASLVKDNLEETQLARTQQKNKNLNMKSRFRATAEQIGLSRLLENAIADNEFILPWETDFETGIMYVQIAKLNLPPNFLELPQISEEEISQYYTRNIDGNYRTPTFCRGRYLELNFDQYRPKEEPTETELKEFFRDHPELFVRPAQRCFRYVKVEDAQGSQSTQFQKKDPLSKKDFYRLKPFIDICAWKDLPSDFAQRLFQLKPRELIEGVFYNGHLYAVEFLFEIPEKKLTFAQARPLVAMHHFESAKKKFENELIHDLNVSLPLEGIELKTKLNELFTKYGFKQKWRTFAKKIPLHVLNIQLKHSGMNEKTLQSLSASPLKEDGEFDSNLVRYGCIKKAGHLPIVCELSHFNMGKIIPVIEVKESIVRILKAEESKDIVECEILKKVSKILNQESFSNASELESNPLEAISDDLDFGEEQKIELRPIALQISESKKDRYRPHSSDALQKLSWILSVLPPPRMDTPIYALLPPEYDNEGSWQLLRYSRRTKLPKTFSEISQTEEADIEIKTRKALLEQAKTSQPEFLDYYLLSSSLLPEKEDLGILEKSLKDLEEKVSQSFL